MRICLTAFVFLVVSVSITRAQSISNDGLATKISDSLVTILSSNYSKAIRDSIVRDVKDSLRWVNLKSTLIYPVIKNSEWSGALPVNGIGEMPDSTMKYKLLFNMTLWPKDSVSRRKLNDGLAEVGRVINLHVAAGVPKENLELVIVIHGGALNTYLSNEAFHKKFNVDNPNLAILKQFSDLHSRLLACGQAELFFNIPAESMIPAVKTALSAQVVLSTYQLKGFVLYNIQEEK